MQCGMNDEEKDYLKIDYSFIPAKAHLYSNGVLINKWSVKEPIELISKVLDNTDMSGFDKMKMKNAIELVTSIFEPKNIKMIAKD